MDTNMTEKTPLQLLNEAKVAYLKVHGTTQEAIDSIESIFTMTETTLNLFRMDVDLASGSDYTVYVDVSPAMTPTELRLKAYRKLLIDEFDYAPEDVDTIAQAFDNDALAVAHFKGLINSHTGVHTRSIPNL
jgi:hypothetical protein